MRVPRQDPIERAVRDSSHILLAQEVEKTLLADAADVAPGVAFRVVENPKVDAGVAKQASESLCHELVARVERCVVTDEPENLRRFLANVLHMEIELLCPACTFATCLAERVARVVDGLQRLLKQRIH